MGSNRLVFGLVDRDNAPVNAAEAQVWAVYTIRARPKEWPGEPPPPGFYPGRRKAATGESLSPTWNLTGAGDATPDHPGLWELVVTATASDGTEIETTAAVRVAGGNRHTPALGEPAPRSVTPTAGVTNDLATITSAPTPDPDLYQLSVHEALELGQPLVILFSTPAFVSAPPAVPSLKLSDGSRIATGKKPISSTWRSLPTPI